MGMAAQDATFDERQYLIDAYQGEVLGEALFALRAELEPEAAAEAKWRVLERLERFVKARLRPELERRGLSTAEDPAKVEEGRKAAVGVASLPPETAASALRDAIGRFVAEVAAAREAAPADLSGIASLVLGHEQALLEFAERELAGDGEKSVEPVEAFLIAVID